MARFDTLKNIVCCEVWPIRTSQWPLAGIIANDLNFKLKNSNFSSIALANSKTRNATYNVWLKILLSVTINSFTLLVLVCVCGGGGQICWYYWYCTTWIFVNIVWKTIQTVEWFHYHYIFDFLNYYSQIQGGQPEWFLHHCFASNHSAKSNQTGCIWHYKERVFS